MDDRLIYFSPVQAEGIRSWNRFTINENVTIRDFMNMLTWAEANLTGRIGALDGSIWIEDSEDFLAFILVWSHNRGSNYYVLEEIDEADGNRDTWLPKSDC